MDARNMVTITIASDFSKAGKSTIARLISEALSASGLSSSLEDEHFKPSPELTPNAVCIAHRERISALVDRDQPIIIKVARDG